MRPLKITPFPQIDGPFLSQDFLFMSVRKEDVQTIIFS